MNNYRAVPPSKYNAGRVKYFITRLRQETGMTEQGIIFRLLAYGIDNHPEFAPYAAPIGGEWEQKCSSK